MTSRLSADAKRILVAQALRAFAYGFGLVGGYTNLPGLTALAVTKEERP